MNERPDAPAATVPEPGATITRLTVSECVYQWRLDEDGQGDWYVLDGPKTVYQYPKWKDMSGVE